MKYLLMSLSCQVGSDKQKKEEEADNWALI